MSKEAVVNNYREIVDIVTYLESDDGTIRQAVNDTDELLDKMIIYDFPEVDIEYVRKIRNRIYNAILDMTDWLNASAGSDIDELANHWGVDPDDLAY